MILKGRQNMNNYIAVIIPIVGFIAFLVGYFAQKKHWKIADYFQKKSTRAWQEYFGG